MIITALCDGKCLPFSDEHVASNFRRSYFPSHSTGSHMELTSTVEWLTACTVQFCSEVYHLPPFHSNTLIN